MAWQSHMFYVNLSVNDIFTNRSYRSEILSIYRFTGKPNLGLVPIAYHEGLGGGGGKAVLVTRAIHITYRGAEHTSISSIHRFGIFSIITTYDLILFTFKIA